MSQCFLLIAIVWKTHMPAKTSSKRPRAEQLGPKIRRPLVLDAALPLFVENGYRETSMDEIASAAGVTKPVLYDCFPNKEALLMELIKREEEHILKQVAEAFPKDPDLDDIEQLLADSFTASFKAVAENPLSWKAVYIADQGGIPEIAKRAHQVRERQIEMVCEIVKRYLSERGVGDRERLGMLLARVIFAAGDAAAKLMLDEPDSWTPEELGETMSRILARGSAGL